MEEQINQDIDSEVQNETSLPEPKQKSNKKMLLFVILSIIIIALLGAGYYAWATYLSNDTKKSTPSTTSQTEEMPTEEIENDDSTTKDGFNNITQGQMVFNYTPCEEEKAMSAFMTASYIKTAGWDDDILKLNININANCCFENLDAHHQINGDEITINIIETLGEVACACTCDYDSTTTLSNLTKTDYNIILKKGDNIIDSLKLTAGNQSQDGCSDNPTYSCYKNLFFSKLYEEYTAAEEKMKESKELQIEFANEEYKSIAEKYPVFLEYFKKDKEKSIYGLASIFEFGFEEDRGCLVVKEYCGNERSECGWNCFEDGSSFENAVMNYVNNGPPAFGQKLIDSLGLDIVWVSGNERYFMFNHNNEDIQYGPSEIKFMDVNSLLNFKFEESTPEANEISTEQLLSLTDTAKEVLGIIQNDKRIDLDTVDSVRIDRDKNIATFSANVEPDEKDIKFKLTVHNNEINIVEPVEKYFIINLKDNNIKLDSDRDGLSDDDELKYGTDPKKRDTDGDGYSDSDEIANGYDPLN